MLVQLKIIHFTSELHKISQSFHFSAFLFCLFYSNFCYNDNKETSMISLSDQKQWLFNFLSSYLHFSKTSLCSLDTVFIRPRAPLSSCLHFSISPLKVNYLEIALKPRKQHELMAKLRLNHDNFLTFHVLGTYNGPTHADVISRCWKVPEKKAARDFHVGRI